MAVTIFRGRALSLSATVNKVRMVPKRFAAIKKLQTRDLGLKIRGVQYDARRTELMPAVARLGVPLAARDQGAKCARSTGADRRKSATAEDGNGKNGEV